jgi:hypothetical protein
MGHTDNYGFTAPEVIQSFDEGSNVRSQEPNTAGEPTRPSKQHALVADSLRNGKRVQQISGKKCEDTTKPNDDGSPRSLANANSKQLEEQWVILATSAQQSIARYSREWPLEPAVGRVVDGMAHRVDRLKALGNGQVPRVAALAWRLLNPL